MDVYRYAVKIDREGKVQPQAKLAASLCWRGS